MRINSTFVARMFVAMLAIAALICAAMIWHRPAYPGLPQAVFLVPAEASFGAVKDLSEVRVECKVINNTDRLIKMADVALSCGCSRMEFSEVEIPAGGSSTSVLTVNLKGKHGKQVFRATISTSEPTSPALVFTAEGEVLVDRLGEIPYDIGAFHPGASIDTTVRIAKNGFSSAQLTFAQTEKGSGLTGTIDERGASDDLHVRLSGRAPVRSGAFQIALQLRAADAAWREATMRLRGTVVDRWDPPDDIFMGFVARGALQRREVHIPPIGDQSRVSGGIKSTCDVDGVLATCAANDSRGLALTIEAHHPGRPGPRDGTVLLTIPTSESTAGEVVRIPLHVYYEEWNSFRRTGHELGHDSSSRCISRRRGFFLSASETQTSPGAVAVWNSRKAGALWRNIDGIAGGDFH